MGLLRPAILNHSITVHGRSATLYSLSAYAENDGVYGNSIQTYGTGSTITMKLENLKNEEKWVTQGLLTTEDCLGLAFTTTTIAKNDKITVGSDTYYVIAVERIQEGDVLLYQRLGLRLKNEG